MVDLPQIVGDMISTAPILGVFIWFVLVLLREERGERDRLAAVANTERSRLAAEAIAERDRLATEATAERKQRDEDWRSFLSEQRMVTVAALDTVATRLQQIGDQLEAHNLRTEKTALWIIEMKSFLLGKGQADA